MNAKAAPAFPLYLSAFLRSCSAGLAGIVLGLHLARNGFSPRSVGFVVSAGFAGASVAAAVATFRADRFGRRAFLIGIALLSAAGLFAIGSLAAMDDVSVAIAAAFVGMVNGMGRDRGAAQFLEQAWLSDSVDAKRRTASLAYYSFAQDLGHGIGSLLAAVVPHAVSASYPTGTRAGLFLSAALVLLALPCYAFLQSEQAAKPEHARRASAATRAILWRVGLLFSIDSLGGGFLSSAWISIFFNQRFGVDETTLGPLFFLARIANALSHLAAAWLAKKIGLVNTMVFTHLPSSIFLMTVPFAPSFPVAAALFLLREGLVEMDVPTRQSYVLAVVDPLDRTLAAGVTQLVRMAGWAAGPAIAGFLVEGSSVAAPVVMGAALKIAYDIGLYYSFRSVKPPEER